MRIPRAISADRLIRALEQLGYKIVRQKGSHVRLRRDGSNPHMVSVPRHNPLKFGTARGILTEVASELKITVDEITDLL